ncbi:MAG: N-formylglutamate amidohydrolase [Oscillospiraceae bacterium]|nr:N-formylglutamate amidohydrolase [Oscillospiraceae bacterium]
MAAIEAITRRHDGNERAVLYHVPHDGDLIPAEMMKAVCIPLENMLEYHRAMKDTGALRMIPQGTRRDQVIAFPVSRLFCDVERFLSPEKEEMEKYGMGFCYERTFDGTKFKEISSQIRVKTVEMYSSHHKRLDAACRKWKRVCLIDLHSFSDLIVPKDNIREDEKTPDLCIGTDSVFTPDLLLNMVKDEFEGRGLSVKINYPYSGCMVPNGVMKKRYTGDFIGIMLEFNKRFYMEEGNVSPEKVKLIRDGIREIRRQIRVQNV